VQYSPHCVTSHCCIVWFNCVDTFLTALFQVLSFHFVLSPPYCHHLLPLLLPCSCHHFIAIASVTLCHAIDHLLLKLSASRDTGLLVARGGRQSPAKLGPRAPRLVHAHLRRPGAPAVCGKRCHPRRHHCVHVRPHGGVGTARGGTPDRGASPDRDRRTWQAVRVHVVVAATWARRRPGHVDRCVMRQHAPRMQFITCQHWTASSARHAKTEHVHHHACHTPRLWQPPARHVHHSLLHGVLLLP
jgi:hypothetical protein